MAKIDLSEFLPKGSLDEFLDSPKVETPQERDVLSPPEIIQFNWIRQTCSCGREFTSQEYGPLVRHTLSRRIGFGLRQIGKVFIPLVPGTNLVDVPHEIRYKDERIFGCPHCIGTKSSLDLFPEAAPNPIRVTKSGIAMPLHAALWFDSNSSAPIHARDEAIAGMTKRNVDFDDLLMFKTTSIDLQSVAQPLCDPETQIERN